MRRRKDESLPDDLTKPLLWFAEVMYYRFEFSRGGYWCQNINELGSYSDLFPGVMSRESFLLPDGPTYLDVLKNDIRKAGKRTEDAKYFLREFVEMALCPLFNFSKTSAFNFARAVNSFFPDRDDVQHQLRDYCFQLLELQEYLISEIGVKPGSLLPVWITGETTELGNAPELYRDDLNKRDGDPDLMWSNVVKIGKMPRAIDRTFGTLPLLGIIPVDSYIAGTLTAYIAWEYGHRYRIGNPPARRESTNFYLLALRWGRIMYYRWFQGMNGDGNVDFNIREWSTLSRVSRKKEYAKLEEAEDWFQDLPISLADEIFQELKRDGKLVDKYLRPIAGKQINIRAESLRAVTKETYDEIDITLRTDPKRMEDRFRELSNDPALRKNVKRSMPFGFYLYFGFCRHFWRL